ncbi:alpha/beta fold hydrolase [Rhodococcus tukisamuensis]|uniref:Pimeloyl-ACP methyl ester carboxylesterase n=1 Tax=Rhodococcus tukisamuensis TaxID=168276 RepID=A0A1G6W2N0_9NOCA|nr:alpha/beta hydrolase [Rhodococcus tukisamuensis]SDD60101.1 Pimeloyl-ACP methyl ester carboxylesterase [Rhodococcus tukisamuensis]
MAAQSRGTARRILVGVAAGAALIGAGAAWRSRRSAASRVVRAEANPYLGDPVAVPEVFEVTSADGTSINVHAYGDPSAQPIVLSHGWTCSTVFWHPQVNALAGDFRVITYDQRGHGRSARGVHPLTVDVLADDLSAVLAATVPAGRKAVLVGHSMGGMSINAWAARYPEQVGERVGAVMLASTATDHLVDESTLVPLLRRLKTVPDPVGRAILGSTVPMARPLAGTVATRRMIQYAALAPGSTADEVEFCTRIVAECSGRTRGGWGAAMHGLDLRVGLANLTVPTTVLVGTADRLTPPGHSVRIADALDSLGHLERLIRLPGIGHMATVEAPDEVNAEIRRLATRITA